MGFRTRFAGLGDAYKAFADRQIKPLLRGMDADRASAEEVEGLAWGGNNLRGGNVRNNESQQFPDDFSPEQTRLHRETIPAGGWEAQAPVGNEQPNILGRLLVSDRDDDVERCEMPIGLSQTSSPTSSPRAQSNSSSLLKSSRFVGKPRITLSSYKRVKTGSCLSLSGETTVSS